VLTAVGVEGRVPGAELLRRIVDGELDQRHEVRPVVRPLTGEGAKHFGNDAMHALDLARGVVVVLRAKDERGHRVLRAALSRRRW
jgi:hypothetical protein